MALVRVACPVCLSLLTSLVAWMSLYKECGPFMASGSGDPLDIPVCRGRKRARRVSQEFKAAVTREAGKGDLATSGRKVVSLVQRFRRFCKGVRPESGNRWVPAKVAQHFAKGRSVLGQSPMLTICVACDATRLGGRDTLWSAVYCPTLRKGCWAPPKALSPHDPEPLRPTGLEHLSDRTGTAKGAKQES